MSFERFAPVYAARDPEQLPWFHARPDGDLSALFDRVAVPGQRALDLGAGPSVHGIELARRGLSVMALDGIPDARSVALELADQAGVDLDYRVHDVLSWSAPAPMDLVFDRGFMHTLEPAERPRWREVVVGALAPGGHLVLKCFDRLPARGFGPPGLHAAELLEALGEPAELHVLSLQRSRFPTHPDDDHACWTLLARRAG